MKATILRQLNMGRRALKYSREHPDPAASDTAAVEELARRLAQADEAINQQRDGIRDEREATGRKTQLRRTMTQGHLNHLARVARKAGAAAPELVRTFTLTSYSGSMLAFYNEARTMVTEAEARKELLLKYGLAESVLGDLEHLLDQFQTAIEQGDAARQKHVGATANLLAIGSEVVAAVAVLTGFNRIRFANDPHALAAWESATDMGTPVAPATPTTPPPGGEVKPAA